MPPAAAVVALSGGCDWAWNGCWRLCDGRPGGWAVVEEGVVGVGQAGQVPAAVLNV